MLKRGATLSATTWNEIVSFVERGCSLSVSPPLELITEGGGQSIRFVEPTVKARVLFPAADSSSSRSSSSSSRISCLGVPFAWEEVEPDGVGGWRTVTGGRGGTTAVSPAYNVSGLCVPHGTVTTLEPGLNDEWLFWHCCGESDPTGSGSSASSSSVSSSSQPMGSDTSSAGVE